MFRRFRKNRLAAIKRDFNCEVFERVCDSANLLGQKSFGHHQIRGNGVLALHRDYLIFYMWYPQRKIVIPRQKITGASIVEKFLHKFKRGNPALKISFINEQGLSDEIAWLVIDLQWWRAQF